jgi:hypothetical protein
VLPPCGRQKEVSAGNLAAKLSIMEFGLRLRLGQQHLLLA